LGSEIPVFSPLNWGFNSLDVLVHAKLQAELFALPPRLLPRMLLHLAILFTLLAGVCFIHRLRKTLPLTKL